MAESHTYVNRSNLGTFLAKIKELIPSVANFLTKTQADEIYEGKLKYYTEDESEQTAILQIDYNGGATVVGGTSGGLGIGNKTVGLVGSGINVAMEAVSADAIVQSINGDVHLRTTGDDTNAYYNDKAILTEASVVDNLESNSATAPLSANQGKVLNEKFDDILLKSDVSADNNVAMLSRLFALPLTSYVGGGLYQPSTDTIGKYADLFNNIADDELFVCAYQGVKGLYKYQGSSQKYCFSQWVADIENLPTGVEDNLTSSSTAKALSANQGKVLNEKITEIEEQFANQIWVMKLTTTNPISRSLLYPGAGTPKVNDIILGLDYAGDYPVTPFIIRTVEDDSIGYTTLTSLT